MFNIRDFLKLPNILSLSRFLCAPLIFYFFSLTGISGKIFTLVFLCLLFFTDYLDGYTARKFHQCSELGRLLDPLADKLLIILLVIALIIYRGLPLFVLPIVLGRDLLILLGGVYLIIHKKTVLESNIWGKAATVCMMLLTLLYVLEVNWLILLIFLIAGLGLIIISLLTYIYAFLNTLRPSQHK
jgi:CDP-diacylglycerol--glycerol-3-phosphate 3-phosphatidyltransferase